MLHTLKSAGVALTLAAGLALGGTAFAQDQTPTGAMGSDHMTSAPATSEHMSSGSMASDHMATDAKHAKGKTPVAATDHMNSDHMSNSQH
jgi:pentapeptide MXKDX repeat protein